MRMITFYDDTIYKLQFSLIVMEQQFYSLLVSAIITQIKMNKTHHNFILLSIKNNKKIINAEGSKYPILKEVAAETGFSLGTQFYTLYWTDAALTMKQIRQLPPHVRVNHFPDITNLTRKNKMASALNCMLRYFPKQYDFYPQTYLLPMDYSTLLKKQHRDKYFIVKPENGCQGKGIFLTNNLSKIQKSSPMIVQRYITNPLLIDGLKFDLRVYVLITCVHPLRVWLYKNGLARFATRKFEQPNEQNMDDLYQHLTNYAINKNHSEFVVDDQDYSKGHKRLLSSLFSPEVLEQVVHKQISEIVIKSIVSVLPSLQNASTLCKKDSSPNVCFQLLGFDILITDNFKFKLLQINQNPSLMAETGVDITLKKQMLTTVFKIIENTYPTATQYTGESKIRTKDRKEMQNCGEFMRIYPCSTLEETQKYDCFIGKSQEIFKQKYGLGIIREPRKQTSVSKQQIPSIQWNQSNQFYSKQKLAKVYGNSNRNNKTAYRKRIIFH